MVDRRTVLKGITSGAGVLALSGFQISADAAAYFTHGVASGDPLADRVILWSRVVPAKPDIEEFDCEWQIAATADFTLPVTSGTVRSLRKHDYTVKVDALGLEPGQKYFYRFICNGSISPTGETKTLPIGELSSYRIGVASCSNYPQGYFHAYRHMAQSQLDLVIHLGDYIYEYAEGRYANPIALEKLGRHVEPQHEIITLEDYRMRYGLYRTDRDLQLVHQRHPFVCVWDDHELTNNTWRDGAQNHNEGEGDFYERMKHARQAYHEWMPIRVTEGDQSPIYRQFSIGQLADLIMLDTRLHARQRGYSYQQDLAGSSEREIEAFREQLNAPDRTLLGEDQEAWLNDELKASKARGATWQILGQQVLMGKVGTPMLTKSDFGTAQLTERRQQYIDRLATISDAGLPFNLDAWDGYPACRNRVLTAMKTHGNNPVVLAGDTHNAWAFNLRDPQNQSVGVEIGTPGITSPGLESFLPANSDRLRQALMSSSPELFEVDTEHRGWTELTLTPTKMTAQWHFVDSILDKNFSVTSALPITCEVEKRQFS
ncbi:MAG: alkaline phosphatase D [Candidatus Azotimanducaceae bacterium]|jgi:alkaline phosphatase D